MTNYKRRVSITMNCKKCGDEVKNRTEGTTSVICWKCVHRSLEEFNGNIINDNFEEDVQSDTRDS